MNVTTCVTMQMLKTFSKTVFMITMLVINVLYVARPTIEKYLEKGIMIEVSTISPEYVVAPAVTFTRRSLIKSKG